MSNIKRLSEGFYNEPPVNQDLFFNEQMLNDNLTWRLYDYEGNKILKGLLNDMNTGASYSVNHEYSGAKGPEAISGAINKGLGAARTVDMAGSTLIDYLKRQEGIIGDYMKAGGELLDEKRNEAKDWVENNLGQGSADRLQKMMYGKFVSAFDFIKVFQGTSIDISLPQLDVVILDYYYGTNKQYGLLEIIGGLNDYFIGDIDELEVKNLNNESSGLWGIQQAPNNYKPKFAGLRADTVMENTFKLEVSDQYAFSDLVVTSYNVNISPIKRKGTNNPLFAEVSLQLSFASYVTKSKLKNYIKGLKNV